jgi:SAM-dependent methyltransferase
MRKTIEMAQELESPPSAAPKTNFEDWYKAVPPWDIGRPQQVFIDLEKQKLIKGKVLDVGCGTGENALFLAEKGYEVSGVDFSPTAIQKAKEKAQSRNLKADFEVADALKLSDNGTKADCIIDCGLFHCFNDDERAIFVEQLYKTLTENGLYHFLCFSEKETREGGPRRIAKQEIETVFSKGWKILNLKDVFFENTLHENGSRAYLVTLQKV